MTKYLTLTWWRYVLDDSHSDKDFAPWWRRFLCRWRGHSSVIWNKSSGDSPDMRCEVCGEDLG